MKTRLTCLLLFLSCCLFSQNRDSLRGEVLARKAAGFWKNGQRDSFQIVAQLGLEAFRNTDSLSWWLQNQRGLAFELSGDDPFFAIEIFKNSREKIWRTPANPKEWMRFTKTFLNQGHIAWVEIGNFQLAKTYLEQGYQCFTEKLGANDEDIADYIFHQLGNVYSRLGDYDSAEKILSAGIEFWKKHKKPENGKYSDLAIVFNSTGDFEKSLAAVQTGFRYTKSQTLRCHLFLLQFSAHFALAKTAAAWKSVHDLDAEIAQLWKEKEGDWDKNTFLAASSQSKAKLFFLEKKNQQAQAAFQKAIDFETKQFGTPNRREVAKIRHDFANFLAETGQNAAALNQYQLMLTAVLKDFRPADDFENPGPELFFAENTIFEALEGKAGIFEKMGQPENALACFELIPHVEEMLRQTHSYESSSLFSLRESRGRFERAVDLAWQLFNEQAKKTGFSTILAKDFADRAFYLTEQARGALLLQTLARARADSENLLPAAERQKLRELRAKSAWLDLRIAEEKEAAADQNLIENLENERFKIKQELSVFENALEKTHPGWAKSQKQVEFSTAENAKNLLRPSGQAMISYFLTENFVHIFCIQKNGQISWRCEILPAGFRKTTSEFCEYLTRPDAENEKIGYFQTTATELARLLLAPEIQKLAAEKSLIIVPDDVLVFLPFEVLILENAPPAKPQWREFNYLIKRFSTNYAYSATLLAMQQAISAQRKKASKYLAAFAPKYNLQQDTSVKKSLAFRERGGEYDLQGTHIEVQKIREIFPSAEISDNEQATEAHFKNIASDFQILHLAMHAVANETAPELSRLLFGDQIKNGSADDNILYANELQMMRLHAGLAVLSACHTGFGKINRGEGVYSLARAFAAAGVPATVMSLWRLPDNTAPVIMEKFYRHLADGKSKDEALQLAKIEFLNDPEMFYFTQPYFWAGIAPNGDSCPMPPPGGFLWWLVGSAGLIGLLFLWFRRRKKR